MNSVKHNYTNLKAKVIEFWRKKLNTFYRGAIILLGVLFLVRLAFPSVLDGAGSVSGEYKKQDAKQEIVLGYDEKEETGVNEEDQYEQPVIQPETYDENVYDDSKHNSLNVGGNWHKVRGVASYDIFSDLQDVQLEVAEKLGIKPVKNREEAEKRKNSLVYVGGSPYYHIDESMTSSMPYLIPEASNLLNRIGRNFYDSLYVKHLPLHKIIVSSVWRTEADVSSLSRFNPNATKQSCHLYATTIDISYVRFQTLPAPKGGQQRIVGDDVLKYVLSEVLRDLQTEGVCYVKHEKKMPCFHITVR